MKNYPYSLVAACRAEGENMSKRGDDAVIGVIAVAAGTAVEWAIDKYESTTTREVPKVAKRVAAGLTSVAVWYGMSENDKRR
jgi:hypothetical protein